MCEKSMEANSQQRGNVCLCRGRLGFRERCFCSQATLGVPPGLFLGPEEGSDRPESSGDTAFPLYVEETLTCARFEMQARPQRVDPRAVYCKHPPPFVTCV
ncbi:hypothetical protein SKAU_G00004150 [Synaphobranchus kaupii]|uniref:Uncharacterized protein n=1 Tax=Synaphobranchus kaupii TaxID=118154 RepID=A0A9Q1GAF9_SYNKA|nr:hypothetical protein SKAU_G00004150 [Synaphobranchus kaupii]